MKMQCTVFITEKGYNEGIWEVTRTPKRVTFEQIEGKPFYVGKYVWCPPKETKRGVTMCRHHLIDWEDGECTLYPDRNGVPFLFTPVI